MQQEKLRYDLHMTNSKKSSQHSSKPGKTNLTKSGASERWNKQTLFDNFCACTRQAVTDWETFFGVEGMAEQVLGEPVHAYKNAEQILRESNAWETLMALYDYATEGITAGREEQCIVLDAGSILKLLQTEMMWVSEEWFEILTMGDARYGLDNGAPLSIERIALLANIDIRTVRNAVSAGDLIVEQGVIDNSMARRWLYGRKGFKPTVVSNSSENLALEDIRTAPDFGAFLKKQRERIGLADGGQKLTIFHPCATANTIQQLEAGVFTLPLDAVFRVADLYQLSRKALLECVMRVFFTQELETLSDSMK